jgi:hypothetical protein
MKQRNTNPGALQTSEYERTVAANFHILQWHSVAMTKEIGEKKLALASC